MKLKLLKKQVEFVNSNYRYTGYVGGYGAGKTTAAVAKVCLEKLKLPVYDVAYYLPTLDLVRRVAMPRVEQFFIQAGFLPLVNRSEHIIEVTHNGLSYGKVLFRSMDRPESIIGYEVAYSVIDEADTLTTAKMNDIFNRIDARNRSYIKGGINKVDLVGTPEGYKFMYEFFEKNKSNDKKLIRVSARENPFLPDDYVEKQLKKYDTKRALAYIEGKFVNIETGNIFYEFDRRKHETTRTIKENDYLHIGMDFNIGKMSAVVYVLENNIYYAVAEVVNVYDTYQMIDILKSRFGTTNVIIYPDASSNQRRTSATSTDLQLLRSNFDVKVLKKNPFVKDRIIITNGLIKQDRFRVNPETCPIFVDAIETIAYDSNGFVDKSSGKDHVIDAGTYPLYTIEKANRLIY